MNTKTRHIMVVGFALFSMFLGAGNLIFPPFLGFHAGDNWVPTMIGFLLTGVGLPLLGVYATLKSGGNMITLGSPVSKSFAAVMGLVIILAIGPLFAIPRTGATTHETAVLSFFPDVPSWASAIVFFGLAGFISLNSTKVIDRLGKVLTPFLIFTLVVIIVKGIATPLGEPDPMAEAYNFASGFSEGYQTMDALASTMFAGIAFTHVLSLGYESRKEQMSVAVKAGIVAIFLLGLIYGGLIYIGAGATSLFPEDITRTELLVGVAEGLIGRLGLGFLATAITLACLTTAVGLLVTCGEYFQALSKGRLPYKAVVIFTAIFSALLSILGVEMVVNIAVPLLVLLYPVLMVLIIFTVFSQYIPNTNAYTGGVIGAFLISLISSLGYLQQKEIISSNLVEKLVELKGGMPLANLGLEWIIPVVVLAVVACFFPERRKA